LIDNFQTNQAKDRPNKANEEGTISNKSFTDSRQTFYGICCVACAKSLGICLRARKTILRTWSSIIRIPRVNAINETLRRLKSTFSDTAVTLSSSTRCSRTIVNCVWTDRLKKEGRQGKQLRIK
jgi:hypothetical protein